MKKYAAILFCVLLVHIPFSLNARLVNGKEVVKGEYNNQTVDFLIDEIFIRKLETASQADVENVLKKYGFSLKYDFTDYNCSVVETNDQSIKILDILDELMKVPCIEFAGPNIIGKLSSIPTDPFFEEQWYLENTEDNFGTEGCDPDLETIWKYTKGNENVVIGIIDSGIQLNTSGWNYLLDHPELDGDNIGIGRNFTVEVPDNNVTDNIGHGTAMAGIIAGKQCNGEGIAGIAPNCTFVIVKAWDENPENTFDQAVQALNWCVNRPNMDIIFVGWGFPIDEDNQLEACVLTAQEEGIIIVAPVGNGGNTMISYPAMYGNSYWYGDSWGSAVYPDNVIAVGAIDEDGDIASYSNHHRRNDYGNVPGAPDEWYSLVDLVAPGGASLTSGSILSTSILDVGNEHSNVDGYWNIAGTSVSTAIVTGILALTKSYNPNLTPHELVQNLYITAEQAGTNPGEDEYYGDGKIDAGEAILTYAETVGGTLSSSVTWNKGVHINSDVIVPSEVSLVIGKGVHVISTMDGDSPQIIVNGCIQLLGTEDEPVVFEKHPSCTGGNTSIELMAEHHPSCILQNAEFYGNTDPAIIVNGSSFPYPISYPISNNKFEDFTGEAIVVNYEEVEISENEFTDFSGTAITIYGNSNYVYPEELPIANNAFTDFTGYGIKVYNEEIEISNNVFESSYNGWPIYLSNSLSGTIIRENDITGYVLDGIHCQDGSSGLIVDNYIENTIGDIDYNVGICFGSSTMRLRHNTINNFGIGIASYSSNPIMKDNMIEDCKQYGMLLANNSHPDMTWGHTGIGYNWFKDNCTMISGSDACQIYLTHNTYPYLTGGHNNIWDCGSGYAIKSISAPSVATDLSENYWGTTSPVAQILFYPYSSLIDISPFDYYQHTPTEGYQTRTSSTSTDNIFGTAINYLFEEDYENAAEIFEEIILENAVDENKVGSANRLIECWKNTDSFNIESIEVLETALENTSDSNTQRVIERNIAFTNAYLGNYEDAIAYFEEIIQNSETSELERLFAEMDVEYIYYIASQDEDSGRSTSSIVPGEGGFVQLYGKLENIKPVSILDYENKQNSKREKIIKLLISQNTIEPITEELLPSKFAITKAYPNPFNPSITIGYSLPETSDISIKIYDILGKEVIELVNEEKQTGFYEMVWDTAGMNSVASGVYFIKLETSMGVISRKVTLMK